jgi:hypothetical protein
MTVPKVIRGGGKAAKAGAAVRACRHRTLALRADKRQIRISRATRSRRARCYLSSVTKETSLFRGPEETVGTDEQGEGISLMRCESGTKLARLLDRWVDRSRSWWDHDCSPPGCCKAGRRGSARGTGGVAAARNASLFGLEKIAVGQVAIASARPDRSGRASAGAMVDSASALADQPLVDRKE